MDLTSLERLLEINSGLDVEVRSADTGTEALSAVGRGEVHVGLLPLFEYLLAHKEYDVHARLRVLRSVNPDPHAYSGEIVARKGGPLTSLEQLAGKRIAYVDPYSVSGYILPAALLASRGISVEATFAGSHSAALEHVRQGKADAAATYAGAAASDPTLQVIGTTEKIPNEPVFTARNLDPEIERKVLDALTRAATTQEGRKILDRLGHISGFEPIDDPAYQEATRVVAKAGKFIQDLVPGAREMAWANEAGWPL